MVERLEGQVYVGGEEGTDVKCVISRQVLECI